jgi:hypothetical protein
VALRRDGVFTRAQTLGSGQLRTEDPQRTEDGDHHYRLPERGPGLEEAQPGGGTSAATGGYAAG